MEKVVIGLLMAAVVLVALILAVLLKGIGFGAGEKRIGVKPGKGGAATESAAGRPPDYNTYRMTRRERLSCIAAASAAIFAAGMIFYRNPVISLMAAPAALLYPKYRVKEMIRKRKQELGIQFKEMLYSLSSSLTAGKSIEAAFKEASCDMAVQYPDAGTDLLRELEYIARKLEMNETIEAALKDFADRSHLEDIRSFADVLQVSKRSGGNLVQVVKNSTDILRDKMEIRQEIDALLAERRFEQKVLNVMPILMIIFISASAGDFMQPVFSTIQGNIIMTLAILLLAAAYVISKKIMDIEV